MSLKGVRRYQQQRHALPSSGGLQGELIHAREGKEAVSSCLYPPAAARVSCRALNGADIVIESLAIKLPPGLNDTTDAACRMTEVAELLKDVAADPSQLGPEDC